MNPLKVLITPSLFQLPLKWACYWRAHDDFWQTLCVLVAMSLAMMGCVFWGQMARCIPLFLGIIACALSERDEPPRQRIISLLLTLLSFITAAVAIELLMPHPWLFATGLCCSTFIITLFGGVGGRFNTIMPSMLVLALFSMITLDQRDSAAAHMPFLRDGILLLLGALAYGVLSLGVLVITRRCSLPRHLIVLYTQLGRYMTLKSEQFIPLKGRDVRVRERQLAELHGLLVQALMFSHDNVAQTLSTSRNSVRAARDQLLLARAERLFERASSSHHSYDVLVNAFYHSDILFRCQHLMRLQGEACSSLAAVLHKPEQARIASDERTRAYDDLQSAWDYLNKTMSQHSSGAVSPVSSASSATFKGPHRVLERLIDNLSALEKELSQFHEVALEAHDAPRYPALRAVSTPRALLRRLRLMMTADNPTFRHALRLSCALMAGYGLIQWLSPSHGYWIMLTTVFVCRPSFGATHRALSQRIVGTLAGLFMGWALLRLFPWSELQAGVAVIAGVLFFVLRQKHYALATCAITLMVLCCFNQVGNSFALIWPRLLDTLLGALIASAAVCLILPDWQGARLEPKASAVLTHMARYLALLVAQYVRGSGDMTALLAAGQNARQSDAALVSLLSNLDQVPYRSVSVLVVSGFQLHGQLHALLGYMTALSVHRPEQAQPEATELEACATGIIAALDAMARYIEGGKVEERDVWQRINTVEHRVREGADAAREALSDAQRFAYDQLEAMSRHLSPMCDALTQMRSLLVE